MTLKSKVISSVVAGLIGMGLCAPASADFIDPNDPALVPFTLQYGDFNIISLQFADTALGTTQYYVASSPGQIRPDVVVATGAGGTFYNDGSAPNANSMDKPYATPNGHGGAPYFQTGNATSAPDPGGANQFTGDTGSTWDANISQFNAALGGAPAVFYFNLNETGTSGALSGTDLLAWAKVTLTGSRGTTSFYLAGNPFDPNGASNGKNLSIANGGPDATTILPDIPGNSTYDPADPRWTYVHGDICINGSTFLHYGSCVSGDPAGSQSVNQNLGANQAAFAAYNLTLDNLIQHPCDSMNPSLCYDTLQIDFRLSNLDNGYEQLFVASVASTVVPEPATMLLFGAGLLGLGFMGRTKQHKRAA